jgi:hypothetical protein
MWTVIVIWTVDIKTLSDLYSFPYRGSPTLGCKVFNEADRGIKNIFPLKFVCVVIVIWTVIVMLFHV